MEKFVLFGAREIVRDGRWLGEISSDPYLEINENIIFIIV
jgi:hypothetical protein